MSRKIPPTSDLAVKKVLTTEGNQDILAGLIKDFFDVEAEDIIIEKPYTIAICKEFIANREYSKLRETLKDVAATFKAADFVAEIQIKPDQFFDLRSLYYPFERFCQNYYKFDEMEFGSDGKVINYSSLRPIFDLNILGYKHYNDSEPLRILELYDPEEISV